MLLRARLLSLLRIDRRAPARALASCDGSGVVSATSGVEPEVSGTRMAAEEGGGGPPGAPAHVTNGALELTAVGSEPSGTQSQQTFS